VNLEFATRLFYDGPNPRNGRNTDQAHPPIHPTRFDANLSGKIKHQYSCNKIVLSLWKTISLTLEFQVMMPKFMN